MRTRIETNADRFTNTAALFTALTIAGTAVAQDINPPEDQVQPPKKEYSPFIDDHFPTRPLFGDTHIHTSWSADAGLTGATLGPDAAYRVSRGETVESYKGWKVKLHRPLDWLVVADHAENLGVEIGQILFVLMLLAAFFILRPALLVLLQSAKDGNVHWSSLTAPASYVIGAVASYWMIDRIGGFWA